MNRRLLISILILLITAPVLSCGYINSYGLFGEVKSSTIIAEEREEISEKSARSVIREKKQKGINVFNIWFLMFAIVLCVQIAACIYELPKENTIVTKKSPYE